MRIKKLVGALVALAIVTAFGLNLHNAMDGYGIKIGKMHVEILAQESGSGSGGSGSGGAGSGGTGSGSGGSNCPDYHFVPDRYIEVKVETITCTADNEGYISIGKDARGGYKRNKDYQIGVSVYNCSGTQNGACCDQRNVRTEWKD